MSKAAKLIIALALVILVAGAAMLMANSKPDSSKKSSSNSSSSSSAASSATITYDGSSFSPESVTVKSGASITIKNTSSSAELDFNSDPHPVHTDNPELNAGAIENGQDKTITVKNKGEWGYHNHHNPSQGGTIIIE